MDAASELGLLGKLPIELRNEIYDLVLVASQGFTLQAYGHRGIMRYIIDGKPYVREAGCECAPVGHSRSAKHRLQQWRGKPQVWFEVPSKIALVHVNKTIQAETSPILYGANLFKFVSSKALEWFLIQIGDNKQHLRTIALTCGALELSKAPECRAMDSLATIKGIRALGLAGFWQYADDGTDHDLVEAFVTLCMPLLKALDAAFKAGNMGLNARDVLKVFPTQECDHHRDTKDCSESCGSYALKLQECCLKMEAAIRKEAESQLNVVNR